MGLRFVPVPGLSNSGHQVLGKHSRPQLKAVTYCLTYPSCLVVWVYNGCTFTGVPCVSSGELITGCDPPSNVDHSESQEVLVNNEFCLQFGIGCLSRAVMPTSASGCLCLPVSGRGWAGPLRLALLTPLFCEQAWWSLQFSSVQLLSHVRLFATP